MTTISKKKRVAVVGAGISGLVATYCLKNGLDTNFSRQEALPEFDVALYEREPRIGGHTATIDVELDGRDYAIDTGFIVYNDWTYPNFIRLMEKLNVQSQPTPMSFSVSCEKTGLEYAGSNYNTLFAQRRNIFNLKYLQMLKDIVRFNKESISDVESGRVDPETTLGDYLSVNRYSQYFIDKYLVPMGAAIWSSGLAAMHDFPLVFFVRFFKNHGLLSIKDRPQWRTLVGGSRSYLAPLTKSFENDIYCNSTIKTIERRDSKVFVTLANGEIEAFDALVMATHSDQALRLLADSSVREREILGALPYQDNDVVLHLDATRLPSRELAWSSWNYRLGNSGEDSEAKLTYDMNILQNIRSEHTFCVSLNQTDQIEPSKILGEYRYAHPVFTLAGIKAQQRWKELAGDNNTWFCGAYWRNGFHEDGVVSALKAVESIYAHVESMNA